MPATYARESVQYSNWFLSFTGWMTININTIIIIIIVLLRCLNFRFGPKPAYAKPVHFFLHCLAAGCGEFANASSSHFVYIMSQISMASFLIGRVDDTIERVDDTIFSGFCIVLIIERMTLQNNVSLAG